MGIFSQIGNEPKHGEWRDGKRVRWIEGGKNEEANNN